MSDYQTISVTVDGPVARLSLDRPEVRNALNPEMIGESPRPFQYSTKTPMSGW